MPGLSERVLLLEAAVILSRQGGWAGYRVFPAIALHPTRRRGGDSTGLSPHIRMTYGLIRTNCALMSICLSRRSMCFARHRMADGDGRRACVSVGFRRPAMGSRCSTDADCVPICSSVLRVHYDHWYETSWYSPQFCPVVKAAWCRKQENGYGRLEGSRELVDVAFG